MVQFERMFERESDVVVIGGGPAGSTVSALLAEQGLSVQLFEREKFPRYHIGESLIPETYWVLKRLGMLEKMQQSPFVKKYSVQFVNAGGRLSAPFYFRDNKPHECSQTWQVKRSEFDQMMLENARERGVLAHEGVHVKDVLFDGERAVGLSVQEPGGPVHEVRARVVVDASGQAALLQNRFRLRVWDPVLDKGAIWTYWKGAYRDTGKDEGATVVLQTADRTGWFWYIPLHGDLMSVGVVAPSAAMFKSGKTKEELYFGHLTATSAVQDRVRNAEQVAGVFATRDYSYRSREVAGEGWVLIGDAFGFLDPLYSSGVLLALRSGEMAADAIVGALADGDVSAARLGAWGPGFNAGVDRMRRLVCEYYAGLSFGKLVRTYPELTGKVTDVLIGDVFSGAVDVIWKPVESIYREGMRPPPPWSAGTPAGEDDGKVNELILPPGHRP